MNARKAATIIVAATCVGLGIGGAILLVGLQFHRSSHVEEHVSGRPAFVKELPESYAEAWIDPIVLSTLFLVIVTAALALVTFLLYSSTAKIASDAQDISKKSTETLTSMERAYLTGGGDIEWRGLRRGFRVDVANYGKTAAYLAGFYVCFATRAELNARRPRRYFRSVFDDRIPPGGVTRSIAHIEFNHPDAEFIYGGFFYRDLQKKRHVFRFILRIYPNGRTRPDVSHGVGQRYRKWT